MLIDWFTVGAQALNFLILAWLLKRFLYKPITEAIDAREMRIAGLLADATAKKAEAQKEHDTFKQKNDELDAQRAKLLTDATAAADGERQKLVDEAHKAADAASAKRHEALRNDARDLSRALARRTQNEVFAIAREALMDLATTSLEERMGEVFTRNLRGMGADAKARLGEALKSGPDAAVVRSAFDMPANERATIQNALNETFSARVRLCFETAPELVSGIELAAGGQKIGWNIAEYLNALEKGVSEVLSKDQMAEPNAATKTASPEALHEQHA